MCGCYCVLFDLAMNARNSPVFIHSIYRSGSTYLFNVFRRSGRGYWCYQEPAHEALLLLNSGDPEKLLANWWREVAQGLRHPKLTKPYFWEYVQIKDAISGLFYKSFSYEDSFVGEELPLKQAKYFRALIDNAKGRPVLQFCRSVGRAAALKSEFGGIHIYLWREPRSQWWSFKINDYFDAAIQLTYNAVGLPPVLKEIRQRWGISQFRSKDVVSELSDARLQQLPSAANYSVFYGLWLYAFIEAEEYADISINIDKLGNMENYRIETKALLERLGIDGLDFSDCTVGQLSLSVDEDNFYSNIEHQIRELFSLYGYTPDTLRKATDEHHGLLEMVNGNDVSREAVQARAVALRLLDKPAVTEELLAIRASLSWRITRPLRKLKRLLSKQ